MRGLDASRSALTGWRDGRSMTLPTARLIAALLKVPILEVLVGTGVLTPQEARLRPAAEPDPTAIPDGGLFLELAERLRNRPWLSSLASTPMPSEGCSDDAPCRLDVESNRVRVESAALPGRRGRPETARPTPTVKGERSWTGGNGVSTRTWSTGLRRVVGSLPYWTVEEHDGQPVDVEGDEVLLRLNSPWNPNLSASFLGVRPVPAAGTGRVAGGRARGKLLSSRS